MNGICLQPDTRLELPFMPMTAQVPLPEVAEVSVIVPAAVVTFTLSVAPDSVA